MSPEDSTGAQLLLDLVREKLRKLGLPADAETITKQEQRAAHTTLRLDIYRTEAKASGSAVWRPYRGCGDRGRGRCIRIRRPQADRGAATRDRMGL